MAIHPASRRELSVQLAAPALPGLEQLSRRTVSGAVEAMGRHSHLGAIQVQYLHRGELRLQLSGVPLVLRGGQAIAIPPGAVHDTGGAIRRSAVVYLACFAGGDRLLGLPRVDARALSAALGALPARPFPGTGLREAFDHALAVDRDPGPLRLTRLRSGLVELIARLDALGRAPLRGAPDHLVEATIARIRARLDDLPGTAELAAAAGLSATGLRARFARATGMPLGVFAQHARLEEAARLLRDGRLAITAIAHRLGFASSQHFAQAFRRHTGRTPSAYRAAP